VLARSIKLGLKLSGKQQTAKFAAPLWVLHAGERRVA
jgi:hypothetical protein